MYVLKYTIAYHLELIHLNKRSRIKYTWKKELFQFNQDKWNVEKVGDKSNKTDQSGNFSETPRFYVAWIDHACLKWAIIIKITLSLI